MNFSTDLDDALSAALHSLAAAQDVLRKSLPGRSIDVLRKLDDEPRVSGDDVAKRALDSLADLQRSVDALKAADAKRSADDAIRKACSVREAQ
jgi:hypothetical protein